jgi:hypothetical protein
MNRALGYVAAVCAAAFACNSFAANGPPLASHWNIAPTGSAGSSGDLTFRVTPGDGSDPIEITVPVIMGARQETIARGIRNSLSSQLPRQDFDVQLGAGTNVLVRDARGEPTFSLELLDSDIENLRVAVQSVTPMASPTTPPQTQPVVPPTVTPPPANEAGAVTPANPGSPPAPGTTTPVPNQNLPTPGTTTPVPNQNLPAPGTTTPVPNQNLPTPGTTTPAPGTPSAPQGTSSPTPSPAPSGSAGGASPPAPGG